MTSVDLAELAKRLPRHARDDVLAACRSTRSLRRVTLQEEFAVSPEHRRLTGCTFVFSADEVVEPDLVHPQGGLCRSLLSFLLPAGADLRDTPLTGPALGFAEGAMVGVFTNGRAMYLYASDYRPDVDTAMHGLVWSYAEMGRTWRDLAECLDFDTALATTTESTQQLARCAALVLGLDADTVLIPEVTATSYLNTLVLSDDKSEVSFTTSAIAPMPKELSVKGAMLADGAGPPLTPVAVRLLTRMR